LRPVTDEVFTMDPPPERSIAGTTAFMPLPRKQPYWLIWMCRCDREADRRLWDRVAAIAERKYGWGDGLPVELTPLARREADSDYNIAPVRGR
jgi:hypothetical protein